MPGGEGGVHRGRGLGGLLSVSSASLPPGEAPWEAADPRLPAEVPHALVTGTPTRTSGPPPARCTRSSSSCVISDRR